MNTWLQPQVMETFSRFGKDLSLRFISEVVSYVVVAGIIWMIVKLLMAKRVPHRLIGALPTNNDLRREISYSLLTLVIFSGMGCLVLALIFSGKVVIYLRPDKYGWTWFILSCPALMIWHDFYFYWTHRLLHQKWLFRHVHGLHHRSRSPSPWAAYAFHPIEALIIAFWPLPLFLILPFHPLAMFLAGLHQAIHNTLNHAPVEVWPKWFTRNFLTRHITPPTHHNLHHAAPKGNYGLWFTWWDKICGTEHADYMATFDKVTTKVK